MPIPPWTVIEMPLGGALNMSGYFPETEPQPIAGEVSRQRALAAARTIANSMAEVVDRSGGTADAVRDSCGLPATNDKQVAPHAGFDADTPFGRVRVIVCMVSP